MLVKSKMVSRYKKILLDSDTFFDFIKLSECNLSLKEALTYAIACKEILDNKTLPFDREVIEKHFNDIKKHLINWIDIKEKESKDYIKIMEKLK